MRSNVYDNTPARFGDAPVPRSGESVVFALSETSPENRRSRALATILAGLIVFGLAGLALTGLAALLGAIGFGLWRLWS